VGVFIFRRRRIKLLNPVFYDTETCGLHGPTVLIQYAQGDDAVSLHNVWHSEAHETLELIEWLMEVGTVGFNLAFDQFHLCQTYTTLSLMDRHALPIDEIDLYAVREEKARLGPCLKPAHALDLMLHARKGPYQETMARKNIVIRKVPTVLAYRLATELDRRIKFRDILFSKKKRAKEERWTVEDIEIEGDIRPDFKNVVLKFAASTALKALARDAGLIDDRRLLFGDVAPPTRPVEQGWAPFALAPFRTKTQRLRNPRPGRWYGKWPEHIAIHANHWEYNSLARKYAEDDVHDTRNLYHFFDDPDMDDDDSTLACMVGAVRWRGFATDRTKLLGLLSQAEHKVDAAKRSVLFTAPAKVLEYVQEPMSDVEKAAMDGSTKATILEDIATWKNSEVCECAGFNEECPLCKGEGLIEGSGFHQAAERAQLVLKGRRAKKEVEIYEKLLFAGRFHASFVVLGTKSSRMAGADRLNPQGINRTKTVRSAFTLADGGLDLCGGDFSGFEVTIADAVYKDPLLRKELQSGKKFHALFGAEVFQKTYEEVLETKGRAGFEDLYDRGKKGGFAIMYGGTAYTLSTRLMVPEEQAQAAEDRWNRKYIVWAKARAKIFNKFCSMRQPGGIGSVVEWHEPHDYAESLLGFHRYFTLENRVCRALFDLAQKPPREWTALNFKVTRRDREQTAHGAVRSALYAAAFQIQAQNMRAAANHEIQATGAELTKMLQRKIWDLQPSGIDVWIVQPMNVHDEVMCPAQPWVIPHVRTVVEDFVVEYRELVPLLKIDWEDHLDSWAEK